MLIFLRDEIVESWLDFAQDGIEIPRSPIVGMDLVFAAWRRRLVGRRGKNERSGETAWYKRQ
jgi:hypothetical protein